MRVAALAAFFCLAICGIARSAEDEIWGAIVLVTREAQPPPVPRKLKPFAADLEQVFGGNAFYLLGHKEKDIEPGRVEWLVPSKRLFLRVGAESRDATTYRVAIQFFDGKELLVSAEAELARDAPLFIRGPQWGSGQLVAILNVK